MKFFYKVARLVILSSQVEACPNIALEALANKSRILASDIPPFNEIFVDFAVYFDINYGSDFIKKFLSIFTSILSFLPNGFFIRRISSLEIYQTI